MPQQYQYSPVVLCCLECPPLCLASKCTMTTKRLDGFEVLCEWASCSFRGRGMEELSDHMSAHLTEYLGDKDALEELGEAG